MLRADEGINIEFNKKLGKLENEQITDAFNGLKNALDHLGRASGKKQVSLKDIYFNFLEAN